MVFESPRGTVGLIKPTHRPGSLEEFIRLLPEGIGVVPLFLGIKEGTAEEFRTVLQAVEEQVRTLAELGVDVIHPEGAPPFMVLGLEGERDLLERWQQQYGRPVVTSGTTQRDGLTALGARRFVGITYFRGEINDLFARYFRDAGFDVLAMEGLDVPFHRVGLLSSQEVYAHARRAFLRHPGAEAVYLLGSGWRVLDIVQRLEEDLEVPVLHPTAARVWAIQKLLHVRQPVQGYGRLLAELPPLPNGMRP